VKRRMPRSHSQPATLSKPSRPLLAQSGDAGGAQSIKRALHVLRYIVSRPDGAPLHEVTRACELNKATCHRILSTLAAENFLSFDRSTHLYKLGREAVLIGWSARARQDIQSLARNALTRICKATGDTVYLSVRSGTEAICIDRHVGDFPIKTLTLDIGSRRPLGVGAGSMVLLAFLPSDEIAGIIDTIEPRLATYKRLSKTVVRRLAAETRAQGYYFNNERVIEGMSAVGVPVFGEGRTLVAALSVAAITSRMAEERRREIIAMLQAEADRLSQTLRSGVAESGRPATGSGR
jgi:DNA-binding IclR family transcriptional regulator